MCDFGIATNRAFTNDKGERQELPEFHNIVALGKLAEIASQYLAKGRKVYVEGDLVMLDNKGAGATTIGHNGKTQPNGAAHEAPQTDEPMPDTSFHEEEINPGKFLSKHSQCKLESPFFI